jgi:hypothetical protein
MSDSNIKASANALRESLYPPRKRGEVRSKRVMVNLRPRTLESLDRIRTLFSGRYPSLAGFLDQILEREAERLDNDPEALADEVREFERRYKKT